jgi:MFS superfamily sulfate permease-like transporter
MVAVAHSRHDAVGELTGLGVGNVVAAIFGGLRSGGATARSMANYAAGARTRLSHIVCSSIMLAFISGLSPLLAFVPLSAVAGALIAMSVCLFDSLIVVMAEKAFTIQDTSLRRKIRFSLFLVCIVAVLVVVEGLLVGIVAGLLIELLRFLLGSGKNLVRSKFTGRVVHSNSVRNPESMSILTEQAIPSLFSFCKAPCSSGMPISCRPR